MLSRNPEIMTNTSSLLSLVVLSAVGLSSQALGAPEPNAFESLRIIQKRHPIYPANLSRSGITKGFAIIAFNVDAEGKLVDYLPVAYTHEEFYRASVEALMRWQFEPARAAGQPRAVVTQMTFKFESSGAVVEMSVDDDINAQFNRMRPTVEAYRVSKLKELDRIPVPVNIVRPGYPEAFVGSGLEGTVTVEFYIDESGEVRLPVVLDQTAGDFGGAAMEAVRQWKFEPPVKDETPVVALARQRFSFAPSNKETAPVTRDSDQPDAK
jgi:TonB family protein